MASGSTETTISATPDEVTRPAPADHHWPSRHSSRVQPARSGTRSKRWRCTARRSTRSGRTPTVPWYARYALKLPLLLKVFARFVAIGLWRVRVEE